ncbi:hypothetical protein [Epilithonimonas arachidiradicis]|uniref:Uncharacterized protein n=1 Tax=Epilithonimonas arachidiradicis TaxID=1617282 RepID=A0A420DEQ0_9FLAO|nr:hypothetical protein [Epilithonimonas arachidiradicis]RKE90039.1 hypothetical protein BXY58_0624 [Epilithonimonas arachidiradicis]GGG47245.1 hypothetical protein GCM10007332_05960 [Epilithonimonas arachidiradicis]
MDNEMFPPTEKELEDIIAGLKARLEDDSYQEEWIKIHDELMFRQKQLQELTNTNNAL